MRRLAKFTSLAVAWSLGACGSTSSMRSSNPADMHSTGADAQPGALDAELSDASANADDAGANADANAADSATASGSDAALWDGAVVAGQCGKPPTGGQWQEVSPPNSNYKANYSGTNAIVIRPDDPATIYVGVDSNGVFRSKDCGATWALVSTGRNKAALSSGRPWSMVIDPVQPDVMYVVEGYGASGLWKSTNAGADWDQVLTADVLSAFPSGGQIDSVDIDPSDHTHLLVESHGDGAGVCASTVCLAESKDSGRTWHVSSLPTSWSEDSAVIMLDRKTWLYCGLGGGLSRSTDEGSTWKTVSINGALPSCNYYDPTMYRSAAGSYYLPSRSGVLESNGQDTSAWTLMAGSPSGTALVPTGTGLVVSDEFSNNYSLTPQSAPTRWAAFPAPPQDSQQTASDSSFLAYDGTHHILYTSNLHGGLWQISTN